MLATPLNLAGLVVALALVFGLPANARAQGFYLGAGIGSTDIDIGLFGESDQTTTGKVFAGYELAKIVGFEAAWVTLGGHENVYLEDAHGTLHTDGWTAAVTGRIPITRVFGLYGKVGSFFWSTRLDVDWSWGGPTSARTSSGQEVFWVFGMRFNAGKVAFLGEYERYRTGDLGDHPTLTFAMRYTF